MDDALSFLKSYWKVLAGIVATIALAFKLDKLVEALRRWVALGAVQPKGSSGLLLSEAWGWGLAFGVVQESARIENEILEEVKNGESGGRGWRYSVEEAPAEGHTYQWRFTAIRK